MGTQAQYELTGHPSVSSYASPGGTSSQVAQGLVEALTYTQLFSLDLFEDFVNLIN